MTRARLLAALPVVAALTVSCGLGGSTGSSKSSDTGKGSIAKNFDFSGAKLTVGSKEFTENVILGKITVDALRAAGATVTDRTKLTGSTVVRDALTNGDIDMYWDYAGTGWQLYLHHVTPVDGATAQFEATAQADLKANGIKWLGPAKFGDKYAIAVRQNAPGELGQVSTLSDLASYIKAHPKDATFCGATEFFDRKFKNFMQTYGANFPKSQVHTNELALDYTNVAKGKPCTFAEVFTTDARIKTQNLKVLTDDKGVFFTQLATLTTTKAVFAKYPKLDELAKTLGDKLTTTEMIDLNKMVDVDGDTPEQAAQSFLNKFGFVA
ncbi:MAG TPA: glycine betaine ABC transporter substrate-binding protein [Mycobacteriales bacterium]|nr:glycine betaine ABC transporter substrate-binding protein [Mycobacteriales bacterium]